MDIGFAEALLLLGIAAGLSGWLHGTVLSISVLSVAAGATLALVDVVAADPGAEIVILLVELALILTLFLRRSPRRRRAAAKALGPAGTRARPDRTLVFDVASFVILASIFAHGLTDTVGARWIERRLGPAGHPG